MLSKIARSSFDHRGVGSAVRSGAGVTGVVVGVVSAVGTDAVVAPVAIAAGVGLAGGVGVLLMQPANGKHMIRDRTLRVPMRDSLAMGRMLPGVRMLTMAQCAGR